MLSIITPVLNSAKFIQFTIESIQKLEIPYEHIIVDGGSTDGTLEILKNFDNIKVLHQNQKDKPGMYGAIDEGIEISEGHILTWVNADDYIIPKGYNLMYKEMKKTNCDVVYSNAIFHFIEKLKYKPAFAKYFTRYLLTEGVFPIIQPSTLFSKNAYYKVGGFNYKDLRLVADRDLFQKMAIDKELAFKYVNVFSTVFLRYEGSLLYRNLDKLEKERSFCTKTNLSLFNRLIFHVSHLIKTIFWMLQGSKFNLK